VHFVVEQKAGPFDGNLIPETVVQSVSVRNDCSILVDNGEVSSLLRLGSRRRAVTYFGRCSRMIKIDGRCQLVGIFSRCQAGPRNLYKVAVAKELGSIRESAPHDLCHEMDSARRAETLSLEIVALEKVEHLDHRHTTRRGRRHGDNLVATVRASK